MSGLPQRWPPYWNGFLTSRYRRGWNQKATRNRTIASPDTRLLTQLRVLAQNHAWIMRRCGRYLSQAHCAAKHSIARSREEHGKSQDRRGAFRCGARAYHLRAFSDEPNAGRVLRVCATVVGCDAGLKQARKLLTAALRPASRAGNSATQTATELVGAWWGRP